MGDTALHLLLPRIQNEELEFIKYLNFLVALSARKQGSEYLTHLPVEMTMDISTICTLRCPYCEVGNRRIHRNHIYVTQTYFDRYMSYFGMTSFFLWLFSAGEPLLHPQVESLVTSTRPYESFPIISTNLNVPMSQNRADALLGSGLGILSVSLDGTSPETYTRYRVGGSFQRVLDNLHLLIHRKKVLGLEFPYLEWRFLLFRHNQHEVETAKRLAQDLGVDILEFSPGFAPITLSPENNCLDILHHNLPLRPDTFSVGPACKKGALRRDSTMRRLLSDHTTPGGAPSVTKGPGEKGCDWLYLSSMLYPDGALAPCCVLVNEDDDFASLKDKQLKFAAAWNNSKFTGTRAAMAQGRKPDTACAECPMPAAKDYQFHQRIRAVLHNAPDWVLRLLSINMDTFFLPFDRDILFPHELQCLQAIKPLYASEEDKEIVRVLHQIAAHYPELRISCDVIAGMLEENAA